MPGSVRGSASEFRRRVLRAVRAIPVGRVATYGDVARLAGRPRAWRAVGTIMRTCDQPDVPCHRVIASGGRLGGYGGNEALKSALLKAEGLVVVHGRVRRFNLIRWSGKRGTGPLSRRQKGACPPFPRTGQRG